MHDFSGEQLQVVDEKPQNVRPLPQPATVVGQVAELQQIACKEAQLVVGQQGKQQVAQHPAIQVSQKPQAYIFRFEPINRLGSLDYSQTYSVTIRFHQAITDEFFNKFLDRIAGPKFVNIHKEKRVVRSPGKHQITLETLMREGKMIALIEEANRAPL